KKFATAVYGVFTNLYAYASMINAILAFGMETTYFRYLQKVEGDKQKVFDTSFFVTIASSALFVLTVLTFANPIGSWLSNGQNVAEYVTFVKYFAVILAADALAVVPFAKLRAEGRPIKYGAIKIANILIYVFFILFFLYFLPYLTSEYTFWREFASGWFREGWLGNVFIANLIASVVTLVMLIPQMISFRFRVEGALVKQ
ncbi:lipopolysaccharide biosynthesis protein, partial [Escherichia coli]|uniref:lipopolysaccharide biosynthesis protein n=1 Tax=Escherichia coli TaxID=562 RepID=UPI001C61067D